MNLASEYMGPTPANKRWVDMAAVARGPVAHDAEVLFASDWSFCGGRREEVTISPQATSRLGAQARIQFVASGPDVREDALYDALLTALFMATKRVVLVTPYYVPDNGLHRAVLLAARRGVQTRLIIPARSNHWLADYARRGMVRELQVSGVEVSAHERGMLHAKAMVVDDDFAYVGSPNFDVRSLYLDYEDALFLYSALEVEQVSDWLDLLQMTCEPDRADAARPERWVLEQLAQLASPEI